MAGILQTGSAKCVTVNMSTLKSSDPDKRFETVFKWNYLLHLKKGNV